MRLLGLKWIKKGVGALAPKYNSPAQREGVRGWVVSLVFILAGCAVGLTSGLYPGPNRPIPFVLGVSVSDASPDWRDHHGYARANLVNEVVKDSPADRAGFKKGDIIVRVNDSSVDWSNVFRPLVYKYAGSECAFTV